MKRMSILLTMTLLCASFCSINAKIEKSKEFNEILLNEVSLVLYTDSVPPVKPTDPEFGDGNCETDLEWKLWDIIQDFQGWFSSPNSVTPSNLSPAQFRSDTPVSVLQRFQQFYTMAKQDYERCKSRTK